MSRGSPVVVFCLLVFFFLLFSFSVFVSSSFSSSSSCLILSSCSWSVLFSASFSSLPSPSPSSASLLRPPSSCPLSVLSFSCLLFFFFFFYFCLRFFAPLSMDHLQENQTYDPRAWITHPPLIHTPWIGVWIVCGFWCVIKALYNIYSKAGPTLGCRTWCERWCGVRVKNLLTWCAVRVKN